MTAHNVVVVILDTVRAQNCSLYGHERETTPTLDALADDGVSYETAVAPSSWSLPSHAGLLAGGYPSDLDTHAETMVLPDDVQTFPETFAANGYRTGLFTANPFLATGSGLDRGFDVTNLVTPRAGVLYPDAFDPQSYIRDRDAERGLQKWLTLLDRVTTPPAALPKNLANAVYYKWHTSWLTADDGANLDCCDRVVDAFGEWVSDTDGPFCSVLNVMEAHLPYEERETFLTGDEPLDEVPLVVRYPDGPTGRVSEPVSLTALPETLSAAVDGAVGGLHPDAERAELVKSEVFGMNQEPDEQYAETAAAFDGRATTVYTREGERYEFRDGGPDPSAPAAVEAFAAMDANAERGERIEHTDEIERRLEDLGYR